MSRPLTPRQREILAFIRSCIRDTGASPSYREIAAHFGITAGGLQKQIEALVAKGALARREGRARALQVGGGQDVAGQVRLPVLGQVRAGTPAEAIEDVEDHLLVDSGLAKGADFVLRVKGDSMEPEMVEGDLLLVRQAVDARDGQVVVAHVEGEATVKRLRKAGGQAWLEAANPRYPEIRSPFLSIIGRAVGLVREL